MRLNNDSFCTVLFYYGLFNKCQVNSLTPTLIPLNGMIGLFKFFVKNCHLRDHVVVLQNKKPRQRKVNELPKVTEPVSYRTLFSLLPIHCFSNYLLLLWGNEHNFQFAIFSVQKHLIHIWKGKWFLRFTLEYIVSEVHHRCVLILSGK